MSVRSAPVLSMLITAALFSTGGAAVKASAWNAWQIAGSRSAIAALVLLLLLPGARRGWRLQTWLVGAAYAATLVLFVHANKLTTAASTIFLQGAAPLYVVALGPVLLREPLKRRDVVLAPMLALGLSLFFFGTDPISETAPDPLRGNVLAFLSGLSYALVIVGLRTLARRAPSGARSGGEPGGAAVVCGNLLAALCCLPGALPFSEVGMADLAVVGYLGVFQIAIAYLLMVRAIRHLSALEASLLLLLEPALSPLWALLIHGETPGPWSWVGGGILVSATALHALGTYRERGPSTGAGSG